MRPAILNIIAALAILATVTPTAQSQQIYSESRTQVYIFDSSGPIDVEYENAFLADDLPYLLTATRHSGSVTSGGGTSQAASGVGVGYIRTNSGFDGFINNFGNMSSSTDSWFEDELLFTSNTLPAGTPGSVVIPLSIIHAQGITNPQLECSAASAFVTATTSVRVNGSTVANESMFTQLAWGDGQPEVGQFGSIPASIDIPINYIIGTPVTVRVRVTTGAYIDSDGCAISGKGFAEFPSSLRSLGIQGLPADVTVSGAIDWTKPAPVVPSACPADVNNSGAVDLADLSIVLNNFGNTTSEGDTNGDGVVDLADLSAVLNAFGTTCP